ncbi:unannotated protein [freshwater metagenome]|uniref:Unannotated protein n=1 Tax=freshwater metagenome TaxID=449393 RepID=A0A6J7D311_9ZZZZ|nr:hypothetical protein [Actinomycetota bacterium]
MKQISPPLRIALVAVLLLLVLWFVALRPKSDGGDAPLPTQGLNNAVTNAQQATDAANGSAAKSEQAAADAANGTSTQPAAQPTTTPPTGAAGQDPAQTGAQSDDRAFPEQAALVAALERGDVVVLVFRNTSTVSSAVVRASGDAVAGHERVVLHVAPIGQVGAYPGFTTSAKVAQAPTVLVIAPSRRVQPIVGYTTAAEIAQAIVDVRRARVAG